MQYTGNELVSCTYREASSGNLGVAIDNCYIPYPNYYPIYEQYYHSWYPTTFITEKSKVEQGFKIVAKMLEGKIITKELTIKEFIKLVNDIAEIL